MINTLKIIVLSAVLLVLSSESVLAGTQTLGSMTTSTYNSLLPLQIFLSAIAYILGVFFAFSALKMAKSYVDNPGEITFISVALRFLAAGFFILTPFAANVLVETISEQAVGGAATAQITGDVNSGPNGTNAGGLDGILNNFITDMWAPLMDNLIPMFCYVAGIVLMLIALKRMALASNEGPQAPGGIGTITTFFVAAGLMSVGFLMNTMQGSLFGANQMFGNIVFAANTGTQFEQRAEDALWAVFMFLRIVGYISFIRGLFILRGSTEGANNASLMAAITHIGAGAILANAIGFVEAIQGTVYDNQAQWIFNVT